MGETLNVISLYLCNRQVVVPSSLPVAVVKTDYRYPPSAVHIIMGMNKQKRSSMAEK